MTNPASSLPPGFRFHPTDEELIFHYLRNRAAATPCPVPIIAEVDIYKFDPWDLPAKAMFGDREWYFFSPRDRKYPNGVRPNRAAASGYWKATGTDKPIHTSSGNENIGVKKALVFYKGRPPKGLKTNWIMHEYRLAEAQSNASAYRPMRLKDSSMRLDDWVLCRIYKKSNHVQIDHETEDSCSEEVQVHFPNSANTMQQKPLDLHKSSSLSEFLNLLFDNPSEILGPEPNAPLLAYNNNSQDLFNSNTINNGNGYFEFPASVAESSLKRPRPGAAAAAAAAAEDGGMVPPPSKKLNSSCNGGGSFTNPQYNLLSQPLLNHQILLNSHLGLH